MRRGVPGTGRERVARAKAFWSKRYGHAVSEGEAAEIDRNLMGFFDLLREWKKEEGKKPIDSIRETR